MSSPFCLSPPSSSMVRICRSASIYHHGRLYQPRRRAAAGGFAGLVPAGAELRLLDRAGGLSGRAQSVRANNHSRLDELGECVHRAGCRKLVLLNSHGGNSAILSISRMISR